MGNDERIPETFTARWAGLLADRHTAGQWRRISAAISRADTDTAPRGGEDWCRRVLTALTPADVAATDPGGQYGPRIVVEPDLLRAWLTAPIDQAGMITVADTLGLVDFGRAGDHTTHRALTSLLPAAGHAGLFGVAGAIDVYRVVDHDDRYQGTMLTIRPDGAARLATAPTLAWTPPPNENLVESAIAALTALARDVNSTLDDHARTLRTGPAAVRAFPALSGPAAPVAPTPTPAATAAATRAGRSR